MQPKKKLTIKQIEVLIGKLAFGKNIFEESCSFEVKNKTSNQNNIETNTQSKIDEQSQTKNVQTINNSTIQPKVMQASNLSAKQIWGKVVVMLREKQQTILHIVCGDITNIEKLDNQLIAKTREQSVYTILNQQSNMQILKNLLASFGILNLKVEFVQSANNMTQNIEILKKYFNQNVTIKE